MTSCPLLESRLPVGSSAKMSRGRLINARDRHTLLLSAGQGCRAGVAPLREI